MKIKISKAPKVSSWILNHLGTSAKKHKQFASPEARFGSVAALIKANRNTCFFRTSFLRSKKLRTKKMKDLANRISRLTHELRALRLQLQWETFENSTPKDKDHLVDQVVSTGLVADLKT